MCEFLSAYISHGGRTVYPGNLREHHVAEELHGLRAALEGNWPPWPFEWTQDDAGESLDVRVTLTARHAPDWYRERILKRWPTRPDLLNWCLAHLPSGLGDLYLYGCTGLKSLPANLEVKAIR